MPKLWEDSIGAHRDAVRQAVVEVTADLVAADGLASVTMAEIARRTGIGRATLYKYFTNVESILDTWHEREVDRHLSHLVRDHASGGSPLQRLTHVLRSYAEAMQRQHDSPLAAMLHRGEAVSHAHRRLREFIGQLVREGVDAGEIRGDTPPDELATYVLHSVGGAATLPSKAAAARLVTVSLDGLRPAKEH